MLSLVTCSHLGFLLMEASVLTVCVSPDLDLPGFVQCTVLTLQKDDLLPDPLFSLGHQFPGIPVSIRGSNSRHCCQFMPSTDGEAATATRDKKTTTCCGVDRVQGQNRQGQSENRREGFQHLASARRRETEEVRNTSEAESQRSKREQRESRVKGGLREITYKEYM